MNSKRRMLTGVAASSGIAVGRARFLNRAGGKAGSFAFVQAGDCAGEEKRLEKAVADQVLEFETAENQLRARRPEDPTSGEQAELLKAYSMICRDPKLLGPACAIIRQDHLSAELAWEKALRSVLESFEKIHTPYLRERAEDVRTVGSRVAARLQGQKSFYPASSPAIQESCILFAHDLTPADTLALDPEKILGLATEMGGGTSHTGILARGRRLPCVVGVTGLEEAAWDGALVIVDGVEGVVIVDPDADELAVYKDRRILFDRYEERICREAGLPARTEDGHRVAVQGNIEMADEAHSVGAMGGEGIGLYRTEFGYLSRKDLPTEEELYADYARVIRETAPARVTLRTLDIGADKNLDNIPALEEGNPALGLRSLRHSLRYPDLLRCQFRAILRAAVHGNAAVLFPLVSGLRELRQAKAILEEARRELEDRRIPHAKKLVVGVIIELPSAVFLASALAREADFFSIGSNDLIQYILGVDRANKYVSYLYQPLHTAVLQAIRIVVEAAHEAGITVCMCGEMASDPFCLPLLLAMGMDGFSVTPQAIPIIKFMIRRLNLGELRLLLQEVYGKSSTQATRNLVGRYIHSRFSEEMQFMFQSTARPHPPADSSRTGTGPDNLIEGDA